MAQKKQKLFSGNGKCLSKSKEIKYQPLQKYTRDIDRKKRNMSIKGKQFSTFVEQKLLW